MVQKVFDGSQNADLCYLCQVTTQVLTSGKGLSVLTILIRQTFCLFMPSPTILLSPMFINTTL